MRRVAVSIRAYCNPSLRPLCLPSCPYDLEMIMTVVAFQASCPIGSWQSTPKPIASRRARVRMTTERGVHPAFNFASIRRHKPWCWPNRIGMPGGSGITAFAEHQTSAPSRKRCNVSYSDALTFAARAHSERQAGTAVILWDRPFLPQWTTHDVLATSQVL